MSWLGSVFIGVVTGLVTMVAAFGLADMAVGWYRISSFEGGSGYFVVGMALFGLVGGLVIGVVVSRIVAARPSPQFVKAMGLAMATSLAIVTIIGTTARLLADVPPTLEGQELLLAAEIRWPPGRTPPPLDGSGEWSLRLSSVSGRTVRASQSGPLWREDARFEDGQWVVPGAVEVFTSRGDRMLDVLPDGTLDIGFIIPLPARPGAEYLKWSEWLPRAREGGPPLPEGFQYRFRVVPRHAPVRIETVGPFEIATVASGFYSVTPTGAGEVWVADARFRILHRGQPVSIEQHTEFDVVATLGRTTPALLLQASAYDRPSACYFLSVDGDVDGDGDGEQLRVAPIGTCDGRLQAQPLTSDNAAFIQARDRYVPAGRVDHLSYATPGLYLLDETVVDTRTLTSRTFPTGGQPQLIGRIPPLGVSPDEESFIRLEWAEDSSERHALSITVAATGERYRLPIDTARMRYGTFDQIDPAWVLHHFAWERDGNGADRLVERADFQPVAWRGTLTIDETGHREYRVAPALETLRPALVEFLVAEFQAERLQVDPGAFAQTVRIQGITVNISNNTRDRHVGVWVDRGADSALVAAIAGRFDIALATGRYDHLFGS